MNFSILHILKKDFRLVGRYLFVWWALLVFRAYWIMISLNGVLHPLSLRVYDPAAAETWYVRRWFMEWMPLWLMFFTYINPLLLGYIVSVVLKADSPIDERALWRTRPVAGRAMFRAKLLFLGLFGLLVPCTIETALRLHYGFDARECLRGVVETTVINAAWVGVVASAALLFQRTFFGLIFYLGILLTGFFVFAGLSHIHWLDWVGTGSDFVPTPHAGWFGIGTGFVFWTLIVATMFVLAGLMYSGTHRVDGAKVLVGGLILAVGVAFFCREMFFTGREVSYPPNDAVKLVLHTLPAEQKSTPQPSSATISVSAVSMNDGASETLYASFTHSSLPGLKGQILQVNKASTSLKWPGPKEPSLPESTPDLNDDNGPLLYGPAALAAAGYGRLAWDHAQSWFSFPLVDLNQDQFKLAQNKSAQWTGQLSGLHGHFVTVTNVQPGPGVSWQEGNIRYQFQQDVSLLPRKLTSSNQFILNLFFMKYGPVDYLLEPAPPNDETLDVYLLYNPRTKECIDALSDPPNNRTEPVPYFSIFYDTLQELDFVFSRKLDENGQPLAQQMSNDEIKAWVAESRLVVLRFVPDQPFSCTMTIDPLVVPKDDGADSAK